jgi:hypothetical protein
MDKFVRKTGMLAADILTLASSMILATDTRSTSAIDSIISSDVDVTPRSVSEIVAIEMYPKLDTSVRVNP